MDARTRRILAWFEYFLTLGAVIALIYLAAKTPGNFSAFLAFLALAATGFLIYRLISRRGKPADWSDKYPRYVYRNPSPRICTSCGYNCTGIDTTMCPECGKPVAHIPPDLPIDVRTVSCQKCRYQFTEIAGRCPECGYLIRETFVDEPTRFRINRIYFAGVSVSGVCAFILILIAGSTDVIAGVTAFLVFVPCWLVLVGLTLAANAIARSYKKNISTCTGVLLLAITAVILLLTIATNV